MPQSLKDASTLLLAITTTDFISALVITHEYIYYLLQEAKDIVQAVSNADIIPQRECSLPPQ